MKGSLMGGKFAASHSSVIGPAQKPCQAAAALPCVSKVILGMIKVIKPGPLAIKFIDESQNCLLVKVRGTISIQEIRIYTTHKPEVEQVMRQAFL